MSHYRLGNAYFHAYKGKWVGTDPNTAPAVDPSGAMTFAESGSGDSLAGFGVKFNYEIQQQAGDGSWQPTGYWVHGNNQDNFQGDDVHFYVFKGDPANGGKEDSHSPFKIQTTDDDQINPTMTFQISELPRTLVTDPGRQRELLEDHCSGSASACEFQGASTAVVHGPAAPVGFVVDNTQGDTEVQHAVGWTKEVTAENSLSVSSETEIEISKIVSETVKVEYGHTWIDSHTFAETDTITVPPGQYGWLTLAPEYNRVTGDFLIMADGTVYDLPNATFDFPTTDMGWIQTHTGPTPPPTVSHQAVKTVHPTR
jgi:hypothetical protein